jgi:hypothetical protein
MKIIIYYHICVLNDCKSHEIIFEQLNTIKNSELYDIVQNINCCIVGDNQDNINMIKNYIFNLGNKFCISRIGLNDKSYERFTLNYMKETVNENNIYLYIHSKGVTKPENICVHKWRRCMEYFLIKNAKKCIDKIINENYDTIGILLNKYYTIPHYSGNFWWAKGKYLKQLFNERKIDDSYIGPELFILLNNPKSYDFYPLFDIFRGFCGYVHDLDEINYSFK